MAKVKDIQKAARLRVAQEYESGTSDRPTQVALREAIQKGDKPYFEVEQAEETLRRVHSGRYQY